MLSNEEITKLQDLANNLQTTFAQTKHKLEELTQSFEALQDYERVFGPPTLSLEEVQSLPFCNEPMEKEVAASLERSKNPYVVLYMQVYRDQQEAKEAVTKQRVMAESAFEFVKELTRRNSSSSRRKNE